MNIGIRQASFRAAVIGLALTTLGLAEAAMAQGPMPDGGYDDPGQYAPPGGAVDYGAAAAGAPACQQCGCGCGSQGCNACGCGASPSYFDNCNTRCDTGFGRIEYLMWWSRGRSVPPLATTSPNGTPQADAGVLTDPDTEVLFGDEDIGNRLRSGGRITVGRTIGQTGEFSVNGRFFGMEDSQASFFAASDGDPILARPFFNVVLGQSDALLVAFPGITDQGSIGIQAHNDVIGADVYLRNIFWWDECKRVDFLVGYQFSRIDDSIFIDSDFTSIDPFSTNPVGTTFSVSDSFRMQNEFHGGQIGVITEWKRGRAWFELLTKVAVGNMRERAILRGETVRTEPNLAPTVDASGLLVQGTNAGDRVRDELAFIPELGFTVGYHLNSRLSLTMGYSFIYWSDVLLAGDQIDLQVNLSQNPGPIVGDPRPSFAFNDSDFWLQGLSFGAECRF